MDRNTAGVIHEIPLERRTPHGHFSAGLEPVVSVDRGDTIRFSTIDSGCGLEPAAPGSTDRKRFEPREPRLDDGHPLIGPVEVRGAAAGQTLECPMERVSLTLDVRDDLELKAPIARTAAAWITFGFDEDLDDAVALALDAMLELMAREHGLERREALALASVVVDLRVTQVVNGAKGIHAVLRDDAIRM